METSSTQHMTIILLVAVLLAAVAVTTVIYFMPSLNPIAQNSGEVVMEDDPLLGVPAAQGFNTGVLQRPDYVGLDASLFARGLVPVQPPTGTGKTNLFQ